MPTKVPSADPCSHVQLLRYHIVPGVTVADLTAVKAALQTLVTAHTLQVRCAWP